MISVNGDNRENNYNDRHENNYNYCINNEHDIDNRESKHGNIGNNNNEYGVDNYERGFGKSEIVWTWFR